MLKGICKIKRGKNNDGLHVPLWTGIFMARANRLFQTSALHVCGCLFTKLFICNLFMAFTSP